MSGLPTGWLQLRVRDLARADEQPVLTGPFGTNIGKDDFTSSGCPVLTIGCLTDAGIRAEKSMFVSREKARELERYRLRPGDLLFSRMASVGRAGMVPQELDGALFNYHIMRLRLSDELMLPELFLAYVRGAAEVTRYLEHVNHGATRDGINTTQLLDMPVSVPPMADQHRIVERLRRLKAKSSAARASLDHVPTRLEKLRQSILAAAFRGDLTKDWRAKNKNVEPATVLLDRIPPAGGKQSGRAATSSVREGRAALAVGPSERPAPENWGWTFLARVARMESGHTPSRNHPEYWNGDIPWIGIKDAREHNGGEIERTTQTVTQLGIDNSASRLLPARTVCLSRTASVGYVTIMAKPMATSQDFANWICTGALVPEYLMYALLAEGDHIRTFGEGTTHTTIYFPELKALHVCLAPLDEQVEIVRRVRDALANLAKLAVASVNMASATAQLERSILASAFQA